MSIKTIIATAGMLCAVTLSSGPARPAMEPEAVDVLTSSNPDFAQARRAVDAKDWQGAIKWLAAADRRNAGNADIHNLFGYAYRNSGQLDLALRHYQRALQIDPRHRGAHEYIGEAYLMLNDVARAEEHLAILKKICPGACEERDDLDKKIAAHRARKP